MIEYIPEDKRDRRTLLLAIAYARLFSISNADVETGGIKLLWTHTAMKN